MESQLDLGGDGGVEGQDTKKKPNTTETWSGRNDEDMHLAIACTTPGTHDSVSNRKLCN